MTVLGLLAFIAMAGIRVLHQLEVPLTPARILQLVGGDSEPPPSSPVIVDMKDVAPRTIQVCRMFREVLSRGKDAQLDLTAIDPIIESSNPVAGKTIAFFVGWFVKQHGNPAASRTYLRRCADSPDTYAWLRALSIEMLRADERDQADERRQVGVEPRPGVEDRPRRRLARGGL